jgi:hypothetical protein
MIYFLFTLWLYIGMYSYIFWVSKHNKRYRLKWRTSDVVLIPLFGLLGPIMFIAGIAMYKQKL